MLGTDDQHVRVGVDRHYLTEQWGEQQRQRTRTAAEIEQPALAVESEPLLQVVGKPLRIRQATDRVEASAAGVQRLVPQPGHTRTLGPIRYSRPAAWKRRS